MEPSSYLTRRATLVTLTEIPLPELTVASPEETKKTQSSKPPYCSFVTFSNFVESLRKTSIPACVDKSVLGNYSGSSQAALMSGLRWLNLIEADGTPTRELESLVAADEEQFSDSLRALLESRYSFLRDGSLQLEKATSRQVENKFREYGISGSTVVKSVAFFLQAARVANIPIGPHVKAPKQPSSSTAAKRASRKQPDVQQPPNGGEVGVGEGRKPTDMPGFVKITIPLHDMSDGVVYLPDGLSLAQWNYALRITKFILENYRAAEGAGENASGGAS